MLKTVSVTIMNLPHELLFVDISFLMSSLRWTISPCLYIIVFALLSLQPSIMLAWFSSSLNMTSSSPAIAGIKPVFAA